jgi:hypothetical protein
MDIAFITGVSSGIGLEAVKMLTSHGYHVVGTVRNMADKENIEKNVPNTRILVFDVTDTEAMIREVSKVTSLLQTHGLKLLINNAGMAVPGPLQYIPEDKFDQQIDVNVKSVRRITNLLLPYLGTDKRYKAGRIINISSISGIFTSPFNAAYSVSKYALEALSDGYRRELAAMGIKVSIIQPGPIRTEIWKKNLGQLEPYINTEYGAILKNADRIIQNTEKSALPVSAVTDVIHKILNTNSPKHRYLVHAKPFIFKIFVHWLSSSIQDKLILKSLNKGDKNRPI